MLTQKNLLNQMLTHFSNWMTMKRKPYSSNGGQLLDSLAWQFANLQAAIDEYVQTYFLPYNIDHEDKILSHAYKLLVGTETTNLLNVLSPNLKITQDLSVFYEQSGYCYFQNGYLFFKIDDLDSAAPTVTYLYNTSKITDTATRFAVWNVFDEFALYVGLTRYEDESNSNLIKRILLSRKEKINSTEAGLRHALYTNLVTLDPTLEKDEIIIEIPNEKNMTWTNDEGEMFIDLISKINRDTYRHKRWDIDYWNHDISSTAYLPQQWDYPILDFQNGIGDLTDLKSYLTTANTTVTATVSTYQKDAATFLSYSKKNNLTLPITLKLIKLCESYIPQQLNYQINAYNLTDISDYHLGLHYRLTDTFEKEVPLYNFIDLSDTSINNHFKIEDKRKLIGGHTYQLTILPRYAYAPFQVQQCGYIHDETYIDLLPTATLQQMVLQDKCYGVPDVLFCSHYLKDYTSYENIVETVAGVTLENVQQEGSLHIALTPEMSGQLIQIKTECALLPIPETALQYAFFDQTENTYISTYLGSSFVIQLTANYITLKVTGNAMVKIYSNDVYRTTYFTSGTEEITTAMLEEAMKYRIVISPVSQNENITIYDLNYTYYQINYVLNQPSNTQLVFKNDCYYLPNIDKPTTLDITLKAFTAKAPVLTFIQIGATNSNSSLQTISFTAADGDYLLVDTSYGIINIEDNQTLYEDYMPYVFVTALSENAQLPLNLSHYTHIIAAYAPGTNLKVTSSTNGLTYALVVNKNINLSTIYLKAECYIQEKTVYFDELLNLDFSKNDKLYITNAYDGFVYIKNNETCYSNIYQLLGFPEPAISGNFEIVNDTLSTQESTLNESPFYASFTCVETNGNLSTVINTKCTGHLQSLVFKNKNNELHRATNTFIAYEIEKTDLPILDIFYPFLEDNKLYFYEVKPLSENLKICFYDSNKAFDASRIYAIGKENLHLVVTFDAETLETFEHDIKYVTKEVPLEPIVDLTYFKTDENNNILDLNEYLIETPENIQVIYNQMNESNYMAYPYFVSEILSVQGECYCKLKYCHIDTIISITQKIADSVINVPEKDYTLYAENGLIVFEQKYKNATLYINYKIKRPVSLFISNDLLYNKVQKTETCYLHTKTFKLQFKSQDSITFDMSSNPYYLKADWITVQFDVPDYIATLNKDTIIFKQLATNNMLAVHTGYYYMDGKEYFLFPDTTVQSLNATDYATYYHVDYKDTCFVMHNEYENYLLNTKMDTDAMTLVYSNDFKTSQELISANHLGYITACNNFNKWQFVGMSVAFTSGLNDTALYFKNILDDGYAYLDITENLCEPISYITFYATENLQLMLGEEILYTPECTCHIINPISTFVPIASELGKSVYQLIKDPLKHYYLIVKGEGVLDDIIISEKLYQNMHLKNIDKIFLNLKDTISNGYLNRFEFSKQSGVKKQNAEYDEKGYIVNSATLNWNITRFMNFATYNDWQKCTFENIAIANNYIQTYSEPGKIRTPVISLKNLNVLETLIIKVNDLLFEQMTGIDLKIYGGNAYNNVTLQLAHTFNNQLILNASELMPYIYVEIVMPANKIVSCLELFTTYKETPTASPIVFEAQEGAYLSELFDLQETCNATLQSFVLKDVYALEAIEFYVHGAKENFENEVFTPWQKIEMTATNLVTPIMLEKIRYLQFKIILHNQFAKVNIDYFEVLQESEE